MSRSTSRLPLRWACRSRPIRISFPARTIHASSFRLAKRVAGATDISHSQFLAHAKADSDFNPLQQPTAGSKKSSTHPSYGRLDPTNSHLFKLILPLPTSLSNPSRSGITPTAFLLHPSQPLSHLSRLITGSLPPSERNAEITYLALTGKEADLETHLRNAEAEEAENGAGERQEGGPHLAERERSKGKWQEVSWSQSTDLSDFIKQSSRLNERFKVVISPEEKEGGLTPEGKEEKGVTVEVVIPSFASRTTYLRERLVKLSKELDTMTKKKKALFTDAGWDLMEPVTWATGFGALLCGTGFLIYHNREVSYSSLLDLSITARQRTLYDTHGLDIERWTEMVSEAKTLRREIKRIAGDYDLEWQGELENLQSMEKYTPRPQATSSAPSTTFSTSQHQDAAPEIDRAKASEEGDDKINIDIDKTINEASEMAEQTKERADKAKEAERKGEVMDERAEGGKKGEAIWEDEKEGARWGREKARKAIEKK